MKKVYSYLVSTCVASLMLQASYPQILFPSLNEKNVILSNSNSANHSAALQDTLRPPSFITQHCDTALTAYYFNPPDTGWATGNNALFNGSFYLHGTECAQRYSVGGSGLITDVLVFFEHATGTNGIAYAKIYNVVNQLPSLVQATSDSLTTGYISSNLITDFSFTPPYSFNGKFAASIVYPNPANGDTVAVIGTKFTCNNGDSAGIIKLDHGVGWYYLNYLVSYTHYPDSTIDLYILPIVSNLISSSDPPTANGLSLLGAYPNPASAYLDINYRVAATTQASVEVFDLKGTIYYKEETKAMAGDHHFNLDMKGMAAGNYFYTIKTDQASFSSKFTVVK